MTSRLLSRSSPFRAVVTAPTGSLHRASAAVVQTTPARSLFRSGTLSAATPRFYATSEEKEKKAVKPAAAQSEKIIDGGLVTAGLGGLAYLFSQEIVWYNEDALLAGCFFTCLATGVYKLRQPFNEWAAQSSNHIRKVLEDARARHRGIVQARIDEVDQMSDIVDVTKSLFEMSKDMAVLEAKAFELQQKSAVANEVKTVLDSWVRHETAIRQQEQNEIARTIIERVRKQLTDPKVQDQILKQAVEDVEQLVARN